MFHSRLLHLRISLIILLFISWSPAIFCQPSSPAFKVIAFYTGKHDLAHISFINEANRWFPAVAARYNFQYDTTSNWKNLNKAFLSAYKVVIFLDSRPEVITQRMAFENYMNEGGAWMGFHFAGFALTPSAYNQDWDWYHNKFLGAGSYASNTWRPTPAILKIEAPLHPSVKGLPATIRSSASEWYRWSNDLRSNTDIQILLSIDSTSFPLGTGPKADEIWHSGYFPVAWTNKNYKMIYMNMGHNDIDYENKTNMELSFTFNNPQQDQFVINSLRWLAGKK